MKSRQNALYEYLLEKGEKGNLNGQIDFSGHTFESFLENLPETP